MSAHEKALRALKRHDGTTWSWLPGKRPTKAAPAGEFPGGVGQVTKTATGYQAKGNGVAGLGATPDAAVAAWAEADEYARRGKKTR